MNDLRLQISENLAKLGKQHADLKIQDLHLEQKSIDQVISTPYLNFDFSKQRIDNRLLTGYSLFRINLISEIISRCY